MKVGQESAVTVEISNASSAVIGSMEPAPVLISYHWLRSDGQTEVFDGVRSRIQPLLVAGAKRCFEARVVAPSRPDEFTLRLTLVQEGVQWFDAPPIKVMADAFIEVVP